MDISVRRITAGAFARFLRHAVPDAPQLPGAEKWRAVAGALTGIFVTGLLSQYWLGVSSAGSAYLIAPMGASAVLLFAVPASPLAQPWSIMGGNVLSALVGIFAVKIFGDPVLSAAFGVAGAIGLMAACRCLHPPGGAVALTATLGGPDIFGAGFMFALFPVAANSALLLLTALAFNNATRHSYPHAAPAPHGKPAGQEPLAFTHEDIEAVLGDYGDFLDVSPEDVETLIRDVEARVHARAAASQTPAARPALKRAS
ncbi:HPP family protein [Tepidicaulis sp.]|uniref:HPP family protein n=1 Tax=Tepidicaulis sp. TaxID=1920809 RepID=UPI003B5C292D